MYVVVEFEIFGLCNKTATCTVLVNRAFLHNLFIVVFCVSQSGIAMYVAWYKH